MGKPLLTILLLGALFLARNAIQSADETLREQEIILRQLTQEIQSHLKSLSTPQSSPQQPAATKQIPALNTKERFLEIISPPQSPSEKPLAEDNRWLEKVALKINCLKQRRGSTFFYHTRKAGGTTIHDWLRSLSSQWRVPYYELEGKSLNPRLLLEPGVLSVTSLRDPIDRILSLYWYEHVSWWYDVKDEPQNCRTLAQWVDGWRDGSTWKAHFVKQNPGTVYIEVENYYVKSLIGWDGSAPIGEADLERAKSILSEDFDFVLFTEDMASDLFGSLSLLSKIFGSSTNALKKKRNKSDQTTRQRLESQLAKDQVCCKLIHQ